MNKKIYHIHFGILIAFITFFISCSDDFLNKGYWKPVLSVEANAEAPKEQAEQQEISFTIPGAGNSTASLVVYPIWMNPISMKSKVSEDVVTVSYYYDASFNWSLSSMPKFTFGFEFEGLGQVDVLTDFSKNLSSVLEFQPQIINFGTEEVIKTVQVTNRSDRDIELRMLSCPDWIKQKDDIFFLPAGGSENIIFYCERNYTGTDVSTKTGTISLTNQTETIDIPVQITLEPYVNNDLFAIDGIVQGAAFDKTKSVLYIATQTPNLLIIYDTENEATQIVTLAKAPKCIKLSEDGEKAFIGHNGLLSVVNTQEGKIESEIELDFNIFDLVYGENDWCYISLDQNYFYSLHAVNIKTKECVELENSNSDFGGQTYLTKIKGKSLILGSRKYISPSGVILGDITYPTSIKENYWHETYGRLFLSEDQQYILGSYGLICKTPNMETGDLFLYNSVAANEIFPSEKFRWIEHSQTMNRMWTTATSYLEPDPAIRYYETTDFTLQGTISPRRSPGTVNGISTIFPTIAHYLFVDKADKNIYIIKNIIVGGKDTDYNSWSVEKINLYEQ